MTPALLLVTLMAAQSENVSVEPVTCWWRTSATSVRVGEPFTVILTCSLLQTDAARVIADESRLEAAVIQLPPFEVVGGARAEDLTTAGRRFVQFEYRLRTIAENVFASEVALPPLEISYRVESRVASGDSLAGRDRTYALPPLTMRVLSLVPDTADDIREAPVATFAEIEEVSSRGTMFRVAAAALMAVGALMLAVVIVSALRVRRASRPVAARNLSDAAVLGGVRKELTGVRAQAQASGWDAALADRAHAAIRIVAAYAAGRPVAQRADSAGSSPVSTGEVLVHRGTGQAIAVSSAVVSVNDDELRDALTRFTAARYGREPHFDSGLDEALETVARRADQLIAKRPWSERLWMR